MLAHDAVAAAVLHKHFSINSAGGIIQFVNGSRLRLARPHPPPSSVFAMVFAGFSCTVPTPGRGWMREHKHIPRACAGNRAQFLAKTAGMEDTTPHTVQACKKMRQYMFQEQTMQLQQGNIVNE